MKRWINRGPGRSFRGRERKVVFGGMKSEVELERGSGCMMLADDIFGECFESLEYGWCRFDIAVSGDSVQLCWFTATSLKSESIINARNGRIEEYDF